ncbi:MAG: PRC-barrel domain-containing protein [Saprospiraceae bacterium]
MNNRQLSSTSIVGTKVNNKEGKHLGDIKDLMINTNTGEITYAVLSFGGFLGMGDKLFAIPFEAFEVNRENETFMLNITKEKLDNAPGFNKDNWPSNPSNEFLDSIYTHYGYTPSWNRSRRLEMA